MVFENRNPNSQAASKEFLQLLTKHKANLAAQLGPRAATPAPKLSGPEFK